MRRASLLVMLACASAPVVLTAQRVMPATRPFELPLAAPSPSGVVGRIIAVGEGDTRFGRGTEADVTVGEGIPVLLLRDGPTPWTLDLALAAQARFSLTDPKSALLGTDWTVGFTAHGPVGRLRVAAQLYHESSHLGDEYAERFGVTRLDWTREIARLWVGLPLGGTELRLGLGRVLADELGLPPGLATLAVDHRGKDGMVGRTPGRLILGVVAEATGAQDWNPSVALRAGVELGPRRGRRMALSLVAYDGWSTQRQFWTQRSRYVGGELRFDL